MTIHGHSSMGAAASDMLRCAPIGVFRCPGCDLLPLPSPLRLPSPARLTLVECRHRYGHRAVRMRSCRKHLLAKPHLMLGGGPEYVEILVPPLPNQPKKSLEDQGVEPLDDSGDDGVTKRAGTRRKATFSIVELALAPWKSRKDLQQSPRGDVQAGEFTLPWSVGYTYVVVDKATGDKVAVKTIEKKQMTLPISVSDVKREVKIWRTLSRQENLVQFYASFEDDDLLYIVMEFSGERRRF